MNNVFIEKQSLITFWLIGVVVLAFGILGYHIISEIRDVGYLSVSMEYIVMVILIVGVLLIRLQTKIDQDGIWVQFIPFIFRRRWAWEDIQEAYIREYGLFDYGGWGYRYSIKHGAAITTKGKFGVQLILKNGRKILIGTQRPEEVKVLISKYAIDDE